MSSYDHLDTVEPLFCHGRQLRFAGHRENWVFEEVRGHPTEWRNLWRIYEAAAPHGAMVDAGANIGLSSVPASEFFPAVWAFEPDGFNFGLLQHNAALNGAGNVRPVNVALSDQDGTEKFYLGPDSCGVCHSLTEAVPRQVFGGTRQVEVVTRRLDCYAHEIGALAFLQVDVEGNDMRVLHGADALVARWRPLIRVEFAPKMWAAAGFDDGHLLQFAGKHGCALWADFGNNWCPVSGALLREFFALWRERHWGWIDLWLVPHGKFGGVFR